MFNFLKRHPTSRSTTPQEIVWADQAIEQARALTTLYQSAPSAEQVPSLQASIQLFEAARHHYKAHGLLMETATVETDLATS